MNLEQKLAAGITKRSISSDYRVVGAEIRVWLCFLFSIRLLADSDSSLEVALHGDAGAQASRVPVLRPTRKLILIGIDQARTILRKKNNNIYIENKKTQECQGDHRGLQLEHNQYK